MTILLFEPSVSATLQPNFCLAFCKSPSKAKIINFYIVKSRDSSKAKIIKHFYIVKPRVWKTFLHGSCNAKNSNFKIRENCVRTCDSAIRSWGKIEGRA
ncbi:hypothetical protein Celaphus_00008024, partial [Cervus elaphus hippelaphus]